MFEIKVPMMTGDAFSLDEAIEKTKKLFNKYLQQKKDPKKFSMLAFHMEDKIFGIPTPDADITGFLVYMASKQTDDFTIISVVPLEKGLILTVENDDFCSEEFFQYNGKTWTPFQEQQEQEK